LPSLVYHTVKQKGIRRNDHEVGQGYTAKASFQVEGRELIETVLIRQLSLNESKIFQSRDVKIGEERDISSALILESHANPIERKKEKKRERKR